MIRAIAKRVAGPLWFGVLCVIAPTKVLATIMKGLCHNFRCRAILIKCLNVFYLAFSTILAIVVVWLVPKTALIGGPFGTNTIPAILLSYYCISRINEVFIAFLVDASSHLRPHISSSSLQYNERLPLAMRSYLELIINYGLLCYFLQYPRLGFDHILNPWQAIYYSGCTITTLGYGDIHPIHPISQFMALYEVINGFALIVISFTVYVSRSMSASEYREDSE